MAGSPPVGVKPRAPRPFISYVNSPLEDIELVQDFIQEATERLDLVTDYALGAEQGDAESWAALRREMHSLKGAAGFLGMDAFSELCHELEDFLLRSAPDQAGEEFDVVHEACDFLREIVDGLEGIAQMSAGTNPATIGSERGSVLSRRLRAG